LGPWFGELGFRGQPGVLINTLTNNIIFVCVGILPNDLVTPVGKRGEIEGKGRKITATTRHKKATKAPNVRHMSLYGWAEQAEEAQEAEEACPWP